ncbi:hypothetical protein HanXRQr2_Chr14g0663671 [Helianthus annuus]|uniref:Uncharacterized protein n=1 Tax=Helianthus annuus TaxID=4232 RepID=A0A9K3EBF8_HELAN|nr:hypothetical protein HanXRQr2_Chr14g0663671 [Helianthus annuus]KAJ0842021.1 hypothetical protein HanPSC8_Chr14g0636951 [Helianthus annuus]
MFIRSLNKRTSRRTSSRTVHERSVRLQAYVKVKRLVSYPSNQIVFTTGFRMVNGLPPGYNFKKNDPETVNI